MKASRYLTHIKRLADMDQGVRRFYERIEPLVVAWKLGPVLWQLPPNFHRNDERLGAALAALPTGRHAFEFRHPSWFADEVYELLRARGVALVIADRPEIRRFQTHERTADFAFLRFHHGGGDGSYSYRRLGAWARRIEEWREADVFAYFNNDWRVTPSRTRSGSRTGSAGSRPLPIPTDAESRSCTRSRRTRCSTWSRG